MIVVLTGGTGGAKFVDGLRQIVPAKDLTIIVNTGDDLQWWGLYVSPDLDSITYVLAGLLSKERGWGVKGDTFFCLQAMGELGEPIWFHTGDRDLAVHLLRSKMLTEGKTLSEAAAEIAAKMGVQARILPMSNSRVETRVDTPIGELSFEEYFVQRWYQDPVNSVRFAGIAEAEPAPGVIDAIMNATVVLLAPSNPVTSIGPILAVPGILEALQQTRAPVAAISPIVGGTAVSGPAGILMAAQGLPVSIAGVAQAYKEFLDILVVDTLPVKNLAGAKQRLAAILDQPTRTELAQAMLLDVLETLAEWQRRPEVGIVTSDPFALQLAHQFHFTVIADTDNRSETDAIEIATRYCESHGVDSTLVIPGDIPLIQSWELEEIIAAAPAQGSVLVPAADGRGTNAIWRRPAGLFPARFGNDSFKPHHAAAQATGKTTRRPRAANHPASPSNRCPFWRFPARLASRIHQRSKATTAPRGHPRYQTQNHFQGGRPVCGTGQDQTLHRFPSLGAPLSPGSSRRRTGSGGSSPHRAPQTRRAHHGNASWPDLRQQRG